MLEKSLPFLLAGKKNYISPLILNTNEKSKAAYPYKVSLHVNFILFTLKFIKKYICLANILLTKRKMEENLYNVHLLRLASSLLYVNSLIGWKISHSALLVQPGACHSDGGYYMPQLLLYVLKQTSIVSFLKIPKRAIDNAIGKRTSWEHTAAFIQ